MPSATTASSATTAIPRAAFDELAADLDADPVRVGERRLGPGEFDLGVVAALYVGELGYQTLAEALAAAADGDGEPLLAQADDYTGRDEDGSYSNSQDAFWSIGCLDGPRLGGPEAYEAAAATVNAAAPRLGASTLNYDMVSAYWPVPAVPDPNPLEAAGAAPILVVGTTGDPATRSSGPRHSPASWSRASCSRSRAPLTPRTCRPRRASTGSSPATSSGSRLPEPPPRARPSSGRGRGRPHRGDRGTRPDRRGAGGGAAPGSGPGVAPVR